VVKKEVEVCGGTKHFLTSFYMSNNPIEWRSITN